MSEPIDESVPHDSRLERFDDGPVVVFTWRNEPGWPIEYVSPSVSRIFGYSPEELRDGEPPYAELVHDDDLERVVQEVKEHSDGTTERFHHEPYRMVTKDGDVRWVLDYTRIIRSDGEIAGYTGYVVDVTERKRKIEYEMALNATIRSLHEVLIDAESRERIRDDVCRALTELDGFGGVWIGTVDPASGTVDPVSESNVPCPLLDSAPLSLDVDSPVPAVRIAAERSNEAEHCLPDPDTDESWSNAMLADGFRSAFAVPIRHDGVLDGVLTVYGTGTDTFDPGVREILLELGGLIGYAIAAVDRRNALHSDGSRDLNLEVAIDHDDPLLLLATRLSSTVEIRSVSSRKGNSSIMYCLLPDADPERVLDSADAVPGIRSIECLSRTDTSLYGIVTDPDCIASSVTALGASLRSLRVSEHGCELVVTVRRDRDQRRFVRQAAELFGHAELKAERDADLTDVTPWPGLLNDVLTDQQRNVLRTAYQEGYFDENRKRSGAEIADSLGIAQPTFSAHMRAAQRNLLSAIWDDLDG